MSTWTADLVEGMRLEAPHKGLFQRAYPVYEGSDPEAREYLVTVLTLDGERTHLVDADRGWTLTPEVVLIWEPYELYALRDGDSEVFIGADCDSTDQARAWAAEHYPTAKFESRAD